jgi:hypothetical protein
MSRDPDEPSRRRRGLSSFHLTAITRILMLAVALFAVIALRKPCGDGVGNLLNTFAPPKTAPDAGR